MKLTSNSIRILACADWHWYLENEIDLIKDINFDICVCLGDIPINGLKKIKTIAKNRPVIGIAGNHDGWDTPKKGGINNIHLSSFQYHDVWFSGLSGSSKYKNTDAPMLSQRESILLSSKIPKADILLSHDCMYHLIGKDAAHSGLMGLDLYNLIKRPIVNICGHHHIAGYTQRYGVKTICVFRCALISYPDLTTTYIF